MVNSLALGYSPRPQVEESNSNSFPRNIVIGVLMFGSIMSNPVNVNSGYKPVSSNANTSLSDSNKNESYNIEQIENLNAAAKINIKNNSQNSIGGIYLEYDERIERKIDTLTTNLHELEKNVLTMGNAISNIEKQLTKLPETIKIINRNLNDDKTDSFVKTWLAPSIISLIGIIITALITWSIAK